MAALAYFFEGGTTTPLAVYEDAAETTVHDHPVVADAAGRWPTVFIPFTTSYDYKVTTAGGTQLSYPTEIPNPDPVDVAAGAVTTSSVQLFQTGMCTFNFTDAAQSGFVRLGGRTIGNAASGATERANADTVDLYTHLYNNLGDTLAPVSGGRGANAAADYAANKTITLPDLRGSIPVGLDTMGNSAASRLGGTTFVTGSAILAGSQAGENTHVLVTGELAAHTHADGTYAAATHTHTGTTASNGAHTHVEFGTVGAGANTGLVKTLSQNAAGAEATDITTGSSGAHTHTFTSDASGSLDVSGASASTGSGTAHNIMQRFLTVTFFIKL